MTIQLPALAARASFIATIAAVLIAAMVITGRADAASGPVTPLLAQGAGMGAKPSAQVRQVQRALQRRGYDLGAPGVDGRFGPLTAAAVRRVQAARGLAVDGLVGQRTRTALRLPRRVASATQRRSHAQRAVTSARRPTPTKGSAASDATRPSTIITISPDNNRSTDVVATVVLCVVLAALAALALVGLGRRVSRTRSPSRLRTETLPAAQDAARVSANGAGNGFPPSPLPDRDEVIGYVTTSTDAWSDADEGSAVAIEATCQGADWSLFEIVCDRENGRTLDRPGLSYALERIAEGQARGLVVSDLQRLSRSPEDLGVLMAWFRDANATLVALDLDLDTSTPAGRQVASTLIALGDAERGSAQTAQAGGADAPIPWPAGGQGSPRVDGAHLDHALGEHDPAADRRPVQRRGRPNPARREAVAAVEHPGRAGLQAPRAARPPAAAEQPRGEEGETGGNGDVRGSDSNGDVPETAGARSQGPIAHPPLDHRSARSAKRGAFVCWQRDGGRPRMALQPLAPEVGVASVWHLPPARYASIRPLSPSWTVRRSSRRGRSPQRRRRRGVQRRSSPRRARLRVLP